VIFTLFLVAVIYWRCYSRFMHKAAVVASSTPGSSGIGSPTVNAIYGNSGYPGGAAPVMMEMVPVGMQQVSPCRGEGQGWCG
jgi:hypothetical protein